MERPLSDLRQFHSICLEEMGRPPGTAIRLRGLSIPNSINEQAISQRLMSFRLIFFEFRSLQEPGAQQVYPCLIVNVQRERSPRLGFEVGTWAKALCVAIALRVAG